MDKGFCSKNNIDTMLEDQEGIRFLTAMPFTMAFAKNQTDSERKDIDSVDNTIVILKTEVLKNPSNPKHIGDVDKYLIVRKSEKNDSGYTINTRDDIIENQLRLSGWLVIR
jgi:hypothetical protein